MSSLMNENSYLVYITFPPPSLCAASDLGAVPSLSLVRPIHFVYLAVNAVWLLELVVALIVLAVCPVHFVIAARSAPHSAADQVYHLL